MAMLMKLRVSILAAVLGCMSLCLTACNGGDAGGAKLPVKQISVSTPHGLHSFRVEIANTEATRAHGLMNRRHLDADAGMLFVYSRAQPVAFWMKNTPLPLDMLYIRNDGTIANIFESVTPYSERPIPSLEPIRAVLELNGGRAAQLGIQTGDRVYGVIFPKAGDKGKDPS